MPEMPMSVEERLERLERMMSKLRRNGGDYLMDEGYLQIGDSNRRGAVRLDGESLQLNANAGVGGVGGMYFVPELVPAPDSVDTTKASIKGRADGSDSAQLLLNAIDLVPPSAPLVGCDLEMGTVTNVTDVARFVLRSYVDNSLSGGDQWSEVWLNRVYGQAAGAFMLWQALLRLCPQQGNGFDFTSDPSNAIDGDIWYNTTDDQFKFKENGTIKTLGGGGMPMPVILSPVSPQAIGVEIASRDTATPASAAYPTANKAILYPFYVSEDITIDKLWCYNGATANGNVDIGIYTEAFSRVVSIGPTAQSGTSGLQEFDITNTPLSRGTYYMALSHSNTTGTYTRLSTAANALASMGCAMQTSAGTLPATITPAAPVDSFMPLFGWSRRSLVV